MKPNTRLKWSLAIVVISVIYAFLIAISQQLALSVMLGYIGILLTIIVALNVWKKKKT